MAKITKHGGASDAVTGEGMPRRKAAPSAAEVLRARGKLGPYPQPAAAEPAPAQPEEAPPAEPDAEPAPIERPPRNASREAWAEYVTAAHGVEVPEETTRAELIEMYGSAE